MSAHVTKIWVGSYTSTVRMPADAHLLEIEQEPDGCYLYFVDPGTCKDYSNWNVRVTLSNVYIDLDMDKFSYVGSFKIYSSKFFIFMERPNAVV